MANSTNNSPRQTHVSPGIYTKETDLTYAAKSLGITTLGVAGETVKGPAFQPILVDSWRTYQNYFGGTSTEKYRGSQYPKYELPYIAKSFLQESEQLQVCRVLGLSGTNAGAAWLLTACGDGDSIYTESNPLVIGVLRSRGTHKKAAFTMAANPQQGICEDQYEYDKLLYYASDVKAIPSKDLTLGGDCNPTFNTSTGDLNMNVLNYGTFTLQVTDYNNNVINYSVTLNPTDKNYILKVLGTDPNVGDCEIYVEELYDVAIKQLIERGELTKLAWAKKGDATTPYELYQYREVHVVPSHKPVYDILTEDESVLTRKYVGRRYLYTSESVNNENCEKLTVHISEDNGKTWVQSEGEIGHIYTVIPYTTASGTRKYYYGEYTDKAEIVNDCNTFNDDNWNEIAKVFNDAVMVLSDNAIYVNVGGEMKPVTLDLNNYKEQYRYASTPWIVSELKGDAENVELTKLFRFHTISDGDASNTEVKVSLANIDPDNGTFDVLVRSFYDTDGSPEILERFSQCNLIPGSSRYISLLIGSTDEGYETKSKYITVEVNETDKTKYSIPAGFLGYPVRNYGGTAVTGSAVDSASELIKPYFQYNTTVDEEIRITKQYFGISDLTGIDEDFLKYKGVEAYSDLPSGLTPSFHMDSRILTDAEKVNGLTQTVTVDGIGGYEWVTVGKENITDFGIEPRLGTEDVMLNTIYEDKRYRKFTVAFYGGWDGWDFFRDQRSNGDDFTYNKYRGNLDRTSGYGTSFDIIRDPEAYGFNEGTKAITSDYYAYLSAIRQFANPKDIDINVLATPGIDYVNNLGLVQETIEMVEEERADSVYVVTTPDKPSGMGDGVTEMYTPSDVVANLDDSEIDSNYTCTYYPWVKYYDQDNSQYIYLPITKDVVRNFAFTDNKTYPWFAAAGWNRGAISGVRSKKNLKLAEQDTLYSDRVNFINSFPDEGLKVWGDKNLQIKESQMNRISKRRLLLRIRKLIAIACIGLIFDPNDNTTAQSFKSAVSPILQDIVSKRGLVDFRIEVDDSQEARDRLELPCTIYLKLLPNLEYILVNLTVTPSGVSFDDI